MALLREDGSLDVEKYQSLSTKDFIKEMDKLTLEQANEFWSRCSLYESHGATRAIIVDYTLEEDRERFGTVNAKEFMDMLKKKYIHVS